MKKNPTAIRVFCLLAIFQFVLKIKIMKIIKSPIFIGILLFLVVFFLHACRTVRNLSKTPSPWQGTSHFNSKVPVYSAANKNVFIIADSKMTELFDMLAPFYLFNATDKANVYVVAKDKVPVLIKRDLCLQPQLTFAEADSMKLEADVIVIPALSKRDEHQDTVVINWIKAHVTNTTKVLAVCDGASTAAATGFYDGKPLTCHASDYAGLKVHFPKPAWVQDISVTKSGNLFSTAGVSNAVEGSLTVISELFGKEVMQKVMEDINYPATEVKYTHESIALKFNNKITVAKKIFFSKNKDIGLLIENGINEFEMASFIEVYSRSLPASLTVFNLKSSTIETKYGLTLINTGDSTIKKFDELHLLTSEKVSNDDESYFRKSTIIRYDRAQENYMINIWLKRIAEQYGHRFENFIKISLDYN
jgi:putative intracellular protease/amidase